MASKRRQRRVAERVARHKECGDKVRFATLDAAWHRLRDLRKHDPTAKEMSAYTCRWCGEAHIGHTPFHVKRQMRAKRRVKPEGEAYDVVVFRGRRTAA